MPDFPLEKLQELLKDIYSKSNLELSENTVIVNDSAINDAVFKIVAEHGSLNPNTPVPQEIADPIIKDVMRVKESYFGDGFEGWGMLIIGDMKELVAGCIVFRGSMCTIQAGYYDPEDGRNAIGFLSSVQYSVNSIESLANQHPNLFDILKERFRDATALMESEEGEDKDYEEDAPYNDENGNEIGFTILEPEAPPVPEPKRHTDMGQAIDDIFKDKPNA